MTAKQQMQTLLSQLPDDCSFSDIEAHLSALARESEPATKPSPFASWNREADSERAFELWQHLNAR